MIIRWSASALADRTAIFDYIEADDPKAALTLDRRIKARVDGLANFPGMGRTGRIEDIRELVIAGTPYIAVCRIDGDTRRILCVLHGAQQWPDEIPEEPR